MKNKTTITKHYLHPQGISRTIAPTTRPSLNEWLKAYNTNPRLIDSDEYEDETDAEAQRNDEINSLEKFS